MNTTPFDVVVIYRNLDVYRPYTLNPIDEDSVSVYAVKIEDDYYILGEKGYGVYLCDKENK